MADNNTLNFDLDAPAVPTLTLDPTPAAAPVEEKTAEPAAPAHTAQDAAQMTLGDAAGDEIAEELRSIDLNTITPLEAMRLLFELQQKARG